MDPIVIIGSGLAGYNTAREFRKLDKETPLVIITAHSGHFYSKPTLSNALAQGKTPETIPISTPEQMRTQLDAEVRARTHVTAIEPQHHRLWIGDETVPYSKLVLAWGADPIRLTLAGDAADAVLSVNNLDDYARFRATLESARRVVILGAGLIGCEFANDLAAKGFKVDVVDLAAQPLPRLLPPAGGALLAAKLSALGIGWHFNTSVTRVDHGDGGLRVLLSDGTALEADVVLSAIGLRPHTALAQAAGITVNRGIAVDRQLATSAPDVFALGDCAEVDGLILPFVMPIAHAARALGATLAGTPTALRYPAMPVLVKTPACPTIVAPPSNGAAGEWQITETEGGVKALYVDGDEQLLGFALSGSATAERAALTPKLPPLLQ
jgi:rubredoxin-NAD+ reductase